MESKKYDRPLKVDENSYDKLTVARMTDHNVRGEESPKMSADKPTDEVEVDRNMEEHFNHADSSTDPSLDGKHDEHGKVTEEEANRIESHDLPKAS